ncbi:MAG: hypothetical protein KBB94_06200 [Legionellaceae bacterium]|nr:hypothetical protein [Legionellaceae bacterium]MBP9775924.1 hypothetical protein [Legionellaceae bacterium]
MMKLGCAVCIVSLCAVVCGCSQNKAPFQDTPDYVHFKPLFSGYDGYGYSPGFTGFTQGYDSYGDYDDGFGPSWWNPRFNYYSGNLRGYTKYPYPQ